MDECRCECTLGPMSAGVTTTQMTMTMVPLLLLRPRRRRAGPGRRFGSLSTLLGPLCLPLLLCSNVVEGSASYTLSIKPGTDECFYIRTPIGQPSVISGNYDTLNDEASGKIFTAFLQDAATFKSLWESPHGSREGVFSVTVDAAVNHVELCFDIEKDVDDDAVEMDGMPVGFNVYVHPVLERTLPEGELGPDAQRALDLVSEADEVLLHWRTLLDHFDFLRVREAQHAALSLRIMSRVMSWTILEAVLVVTMAIGQVLYWRKFFEQRRYL